jgi:hypothetical protein
MKNPILLQAALSRLQGAKMSLEKFTGNKLIKKAEERNSSAFF